MTTCNPLASYLVYNQRRDEILVDGAVVKRSSLVQLGRAHDGDLFRVRLGGDNAVRLDAVPTPRLLAFDGDYARIAQTYSQLQVEVSHGGGADPVVVSALATALDLIAALRDRLEQASELRQQRVEAPGV